MASGSALLSYIDQYWPRLIRENKQDEGTLIGLPFPYLVPSAEGMFQEFYYWDSYFISLGLIDTEYERLVVGITENMAHLIERFGFVPNASRYYFTSRSQPPFFTRQMWLAFTVKQKLHHPDCAEFLNRMLTAAQKEYDTAWMGHKPPHHRLVYQGLSRYYDINYLDMLASCESGWDHSTRCEDAWLDFLPVDLNSILYVNELDIARAFDLLGQPEPALLWREKAETRKAAIQRLMWDEEEGFFFDFQWREERRSLHPSLAGFYPLWAGLATPDQARQIITNWLPRFLFPGGLVTSLESRPGRQWAFPNGWAPLQWLVDAGLERYECGAEAMELRRRWCRTCALGFESTGTMWEKYNVVEPGGYAEEGLYGQVPGFGWSNAVYADFARRTIF